MRNPADVAAAIVNPVQKFERETDSNAEVKALPEKRQCGLPVIGMVHSHADCQQEEAVGNGGDDEARKGALGA